jgi:hypothetical protein
LKYDGTVGSRRGDLPAVDENPAAIVRDQAVDHFKQGGFAASARADDADKLVLAD